MNRTTSLLPRLLAGVFVMALGLGLLAPPLQAAVSNAVVTADHRPLRAWGGDTYQQAPILDYLNRGDQVRVWETRGAWAYVSTPEGIYGWIAAHRLSKAPDIGRLLDLPPELKERVATFLEHLRTAAQSGSFPQLAALFTPRGLFIQRRWFKDAAADPGRQAPVIVPLWYASDVSVTRGTAWQLLMTGARPPAAEVVWDEAAHAFKMKKSAGEGQARLEKEEPLLPTHLAALRLAPEVHFTASFSRDLEGYPGPYPFQDPRRAPFSWICQVGPHRYLLMQFTRVGLYLVLTDQPGQGLRLRAVFTQAP